MTKDTSSPAPATLDAVNEARTNAWNKHISQKLPSVQAWFKQDPGVWSYYAQQLQLQIDTLIKGCKSRDDDQYVRGRIAMLREILDTPATIDRQLAAAEHNQKLQDSANHKP